MTGPSGAYLPMAVAVSARMSGTLKPMDSSRFSLKRLNQGHVYPLSI